jgi:hypothetical protein
MSTPSTSVVLSAESAGVGAARPSATAASATIAESAIPRRKDGEHLMTGLLCARSGGPRGTGSARRSPRDFDPATLLRRRVDGVDHALTAAPRKVG